MTGPVRLHVPSQIVIAFVPIFPLYESGDVTSLLPNCWDLWRVTACCIGRLRLNGADRSRDARSRRLLRGNCRAIGSLSLVVVQPAFEKCDGRGEVVVESQLGVNVVEVLPAPEEVGQVVAWVHGLGRNAFLNGRQIMLEVSRASPARTKTLAVQVHRRLAGRQTQATSKPLL